MTKRFIVSTALVALILVALTGCGNYPPVISGVTAAPNPVEPGNQTLIQATVDDPDGDQLSYSWYSLIEDTTYTAPSFVWLAPAEGNYPFYLTVSDGRGGVAYDSSLLITVAYAGAPAVTLRGAQDVKTRAVTLIWTSSNYPTWMTYRIYRSNSPDAEVTGDRIQTPNFPLTRLDTTWINTGLEPGRTYYYVVSVVDSAGHETFSNEIETTTESFELLGSQSLGGGHGVRLANVSNYIFCAAREQGVKGFTVNNTGPAPAAVIPAPIAGAWAWDVGIAGNLLHVAWGKGGYVGYDITNPLTPNDTLFFTVLQLTGSATAEARAIFPEGNDIFVGCTDVATQTNTLIWIQVDITTATVTFRGIDTLRDEPTDIYVQGNFVYTAEQNGGLEITRWSQSAATPDLALTYVSITSTNRPANRVFVSGQYAYVAASEEGLVVLDVSNTNSPTQVAQWIGDEGSSAQGIYFTGQRAYLADGEYGLRVLDITDPLDPVYLGTKDVGNQLMDVWVRSQTTPEGTKTQAILADWYDQIHMIEW